MLPYYDVWSVLACFDLNRNVPGEATKVISEEQLSPAEMALRIKLLQEDRYLVYDNAL